MAWRHRARGAQSARRMVRPTTPRRKAYEIAEIFSGTRACRRASSAAKKSRPIKAARPLSKHVLIKSAYWPRGHENNQRHQTAAHLARPSRAPTVKGAAVCGSPSSWRINIERRRKMKFARQAAIAVKIGGEASGGIGWKKADVRLLTFAEAAGRAAGPIAGWRPVCCCWRNRRPARLLTVLACVESCWRQRCAGCACAAINLCTFGSNQ